jgi:magnesium-transporting ATPase (P-type)
MEIALVRMAERYLSEPAYPRVGEVPFDADRKRLLTIHALPPGRIVYAKGAVETLLPLCHSVQAGSDAGSDAEPMSPQWKREILAAQEHMADRGLRVLACAYRLLVDDAAGATNQATPHATAAVPPPAETWDEDLIFTGLVGLEDPPRPEVPAAIAQCKQAGIHVIMVTGDHPHTALAIARQIGLIESERPVVIRGDALRRMSKTQLQLALDAPDVLFARVAADQKMRIVQALKVKGHVVAVTGDGVNDAPALRRADVGVAMGRSGTEAAREAADLVLTDDDFATIVAAIREGRAIADNIRKFVAFLLSANLGEVALFGAAVLAGLGAPMTVVQVLLVNVLTDGLPAVALARDPAAPETMRRGPERGDRLFPRRAWGALALIGALVGAAALVAFLVGEEGDAETAQTMAFTTVALAELALVFAVRSPARPAREGPRNPYLLGSVVLSVGVVLAVVYLPFLADALGTVPLAADELALCAVLAVLPFLCVETGKLLVRRRPWILAGAAP